MSKIWQNTKKYIEICYTSCLSTGILLLISCWFSFSWPNWLIFPFSLLIQILLLASGERGLRIQLFAGILALNMIPVLVSVYTKTLSPDYLVFLQMEGLCLLFSLVCYIARSSVLLKSILLFPQVAVLILFSIAGIELPKWGVWLLLVCLLLGLSEIIEYKITAGSKSNIFYLFPVLLAAGLPLLFLPVSDSPMEWKGIRAAASQINEGFASLMLDMQYLFAGNSGTYSLSGPGLNPDGSLGGSVLSSNKPQLAVENTLTYSSLYLTGSIFSDYTGSSWELVRRPGLHPDSDKTDSSGIGSLSSQLEDLKYALSQSIYSQEDLSSLIHNFSCTITYRHIKTKSLFYPPATRELMFMVPVKTNEDYDTLMLTRAKGNGFSYRLQGTEFHYENEILLQLMRQKAWKNGFWPDEAIQQKRELIYENFTYLPDTLPDRVRELSDRITAPFDTDYDKLKAIESYLHQYSYTTTPPSCPKGQDFTDFFLFDAREGYCTSFATAMAVLARCQGIPTRYVEGYVTPESTQGTNREIILTGSGAHAWPEAYIDYVGWVPFEPTAGYYQGADTAWPVPASAPNSLEVPAEIPPVPADLQIPRDAIPFHGTSVLKNEPALKEILLPALKLFLCFVFFLLLVTSCFLLRNRHRRKIFLSKPVYQQLLIMMGKIFLLGRLLGYEKEESETLSSYEARSSGYLDTPETSFSQITILFSAVRYGNTPVSKDTSLTVEAYVSALEKQYLRSCGLFGRILYFLR